MAINPQELEKPTEKDMEAVRVLEVFIDNQLLNEVLETDNVAIDFTPELRDSCLSVRRKIRLNLLLGRYRIAGWQYANATLQGIKLSKYIDD